MLKTREAQNHRIQEEEGENVHILNTDCMQAVPAPLRLNSLLMFMDCLWAHNWFLGKVIFIHTTPISFPR